MKRFDHRHLLTCCLLTIFLTISNRVLSQEPNVTIKETPVITGLTSPMQLVHAGDGSNRIFIAERAGIIKFFAPGALGTPVTFLNMNSIAPTVSVAGEGGLLSLAFHPDFETNGYFYTYYTDIPGDLVVARYTATGNSANASSRLEILKIPHPTNSNHNGGVLRFGYDDGLLYLSTGDGGGGNDVPGNAQNTSSLLGKMLRINIDVTSAGKNYSVPATNPYTNEVYAIGLRNPFRWSFDRLSHDMWIGDVGQGAREEINHIGTAAALGANFGWRCYEGDIATPGIADRTGCDAPGVTYTPPVYTYTTGSVRGRSVVGGVVYRGTGWPLMYGYYIGTDVYSGDIHKILADNSFKTFQTSAFVNIVNIGEDEAGEIYAVAGSSVYSIVAEDALPVTLINFSGQPGNEGVNLTWETSSEENFKAFDVEFSLNANNFDKVGTITGENAATGFKYSFSHLIKDKGNLYYRLKMIDTDDSFEYSRIITVKTVQEDDISGNFVRPSLINNSTLNMVIDQPFESVELISTSGVVFLKEEISGRSGPLSLPIQSAASGIYIVRMSNREKVVQQKVLVLN
jgi:glucose/arabinose dehydrogenase